MGNNNKSALGTEEGGGGTAIRKQTGKLAVNRPHSHVKGDSSQTPDPTTKPSLQSQTPNIGGSQMDQNNLFMTHQ